MDNQQPSRAVRQPQMEHESSANAKEYSGANSPAPFAFRDVRPSVQAAMPAYGSQARTDLFGQHPDLAGRPAYGPAFQQAQQGIFPSRPRQLPPLRANFPQTTAQYPLPMPVQPTFPSLDQRAPTYTYLHGGPYGYISDMPNLNYQPTSRQALAESWPPLPPVIAAQPAPQPRPQAQQVQNPDFDEPMLLLARKYQDPKQVHKTNLGREWEKSRKNAGEVNKTLTKAELTNETTLNDQKIWKWLHDLIGDEQNEQYAIMKIEFME